MGDLCNMNDCDRFMRSIAGKAHLDEIVAMLKGRTITEVSFSNEIYCVATTLCLDDNSEFIVLRSARSSPKPSRKSTTKTTRNGALKGRRHERHFRYEGHRHVLPLQKRASIPEEDGSYAQRKNHHRHDLLE
ncbi:MAG: hypothetical protein NTU83_09000 [Candidatus Hydrogenedentes bacterium]|nr:hypothetical protein [Candidatus Hydrogenedentota bacterium]